MAGNDKRWRSRTKKWKPKNTGIRSLVKPVMISVQAGLIYIVQVPATRGLARHLFKDFTKVTVIREAATASHAGEIYVIVTQ